MYSKNVGAFILSESHNRDFVQSGCELLTGQISIRAGVAYILYYGKLVDSLPLVA